MWGFTILLLTIIEAYGDLFTKYFHIPLIGTWSWVGFIEDFFIVAVLVALVIFAVIRVKNAPARKHRLSRFYGSHTGAAWLVLAFIAAVMITLLLYRGAQVTTHPSQFPYSNWAFASHLVGNALRPLGSGVNSVLVTVFLHPEHRRHHRASWCSCPTPSTCTSSWPPSTWPSRGVPGRSVRSTRRPTWTWRT